MLLIQFTFAVYETINEDGVNREYYSRLSLVIIDTFPHILKTVMQSKTKACSLYRSCLPCLHTFNTDEQIKLQGLKSSSSFDLLDISLMYRLLKQFKIITPPTKGWGRVPTEGDNLLGDDIERIRDYRNKMAHRTSSKIEEKDFHDYFEVFCQIGRRMDIIYGKNSKFEEKIISHKTCSLDTDMQIKYENALKELENVKCRYNLILAVHFSLLCCDSVISYC